MKDLYIIGNGFDKHHGINSGFDDYGEWLRDNKPGLYYNLKCICNIKEEKEWKYFEHLLGELDIDYHTKDILEDRCPDWKHMPVNDREYNDIINDYQAAPDEALYSFDRLYNDVRQTFEAWVRQLNEPDKSRSLPIRLNESAFISFNYTDTLETLYKIDPANIIYIHGNVNRREPLVLGHGKTEEELRHIWALQRQANSHNQLERIEDFIDDIEEETGDNIISRLAQMRKPTEILVSKLYDIAKKMTEVENIHIYGFSFSDIDMPYVKTLIGSMNLNVVKWEVSYHCLREMNQFRSIIRSLGVPAENVKMTTLMHIHKYGQINK